MITNGEEDGLHNSHEGDLNESNHIDYKKKLSNRILISSQSAELLQNLGEGSLGSCGVLPTLPYFCTRFESDIYAILIPHMQIVD